MLLTNPPITTNTKPNPYAGAKGSLKKTIKYTADNTGVIKMNGANHEASVDLNARNQNRYENPFTNK